MKYMVKFINKLNKIFELESEKEIFQKKRAIFTTVDGKEHINTRYNWIKVSSITYEKWAMHTVKSDGYISDDEGVQYPLHNVLAIRWKLVNEIVGESRYKDRYRIWFSDDEIEGMGVPIMENRGEFE